MTELVIAIAVVIVLVVATYVWGLRYPDQRITPRRGAALRRSWEGRD